MSELNKNNLTESLKKMAIETRRASRSLGNLADSKKSQILENMADSLVSSTGSILEANQKDLKAAKKKVLGGSFLERLTLSEERIKEMAQSLKDIAHLNDPLGQIIKSWDRPNGLEISKVRCPIGVVLIVYESRPNVTSDCIGLCLKSGNAVILRGGSDAMHTNSVIYKICSDVITKAGVSKEVVKFVEVIDRRAVDILLTLDRYIDVVIPRGGESLIREVRDKSKIAVIKHYKGICHTYVDADCDLKMAEKIVFNAKVQRPSVCNAIETLLVHRAIAQDFLPKMIDFLKEAKVEIRGCQETCEIVKDIKVAKEEDWSKEYLDLILSVKVVKNLDEAILHINRYGSNHSDAIITSNKENADLFLKEVDSACVYVNASTRFTDGHQFGLGAEMGISTDKLHARGPMALEELTTYKYMVRGNGQIRE